MTHGASRQVELLSRAVGYVSTSLLTPKPEVSSRLVELNRGAGLLKVSQVSCLNSGL